VTLRFRLTPEGRLAGEPEWLDPVDTDAARAAHDAAVRAVEAGQPYALPAELLGPPLKVTFRATLACR
jgi:hypothetical protein